MKKVLFYLTVPFLLINIGMSYAQPTQPPAAPAASQKTEPVVPLNRIVAVINEEIITESELDDAINQLKQQLIANHAQLPSDQELRNEALQQLITYRLQLQMAHRNGIEPTPEEVDKAIEQIASSHNATIDQLKEQLAQQHVSYVEFRKKLVDQLTINKLQQQMVGLQVKVTDADIAAYKKTLPVNDQKYHLVDFYFPLPANPSKAQVIATLNAAKEVQNKINSGTKVNDITPGYHDLGWRTTSDLPEIFVHQLPNLTLTNASMPLRAPNGFHVLKLLETSSTLSDDQIRDILLRKKFEEAVRETVNRAKNQAYIKIIPK